MSQKTEVTGRLKILIAEDDIASFLHLSVLTKELTRELLHVTTGREAGCNDYITKPIIADELMHKLGLLIRPAY